jgi:hypothetical protein
MANDESATNVGEAETETADVAIQVSLPFRQNSI